MAPTGASRGSSAIRMGNASVAVGSQQRNNGRQALHILPESGFGLGYAISLDRVSAESRALLDASLAALGEAAADGASLEAAFAPDMAPQAQAIIEGDWEANVLRR